MIDTEKALLDGGILRPKGFILERKYPWAPIWDSKGKCGWVFSPNTRYRCINGR